MILADKIIELRKRAGWSQEELAEKLDVSRQSISKWESAQSVPDMNKIIKLSELFGVSTDYLLKDNLELEPAGQTDDPFGNEPYISTKSVSMEEASSFLDFRNTFASRIAIGVMLCILSPIAIMLLSSAADDGIIRISDPAATGIGLLYMFILIGSAVALFVISGIANSRYEYIEKEM
ncbi:MAG: helix-turn-helix domain-containing protein, partial [Lachnospiraceae bacterium]|nr:helix-turn-helix domain-containing protein [Lachnospiraceae bacterium]